MGARRRELSGAGVELVSLVSVNFGSAVAGLLIPAVGVIVVVAARQLVTAAVLTPFWRPARERLRWSQLWPALALGLALAVMNTSFYLAVHLLGLGIAIVIEFLGPFALAVIGSRRPLDVICAVGAAGGVYLLADASGRLDVLGVLCALAAAVAWACYILLTRRVALRMPGLEGITIASLVALGLLLPLVPFTLHAAAFSPRILLSLLALGVLSSAVPYSLDAFVLRRLTPRLYAVMTSFAPAIGATFGWLVDGERFTPQAAGGIALVCVSAAVAMLLQPAARIPPADRLDAANPAP